MIQRLGNPEAGASRTRHDRRIGRHCTLWELVLAPIPGGAWLALKAVPLAVVFPGVARGDLRARQWLALLAPFYFAEALTRALSETGRHALVAGMVAILTATMFASLLLWFRAERAMH